MVDAAQSLPARGEGKVKVFRTLAAAFRIFGNAPLPFLALSLLAAVPSIVYLAVFQPTSTKFTAASAVVTVLSLLTSYFLQIPMLYIAAQLLEDRRYSMGEAFRLGIRRYFPVLAASLLVLLAIYGGMILLIVPGLIFASIYALAVPACALESLGPIASMKRSARLTKNNRWRVLGAYLVFFIPLIILSGGIAALLTMRGEVLLGRWLSQAIQIVWVPVSATFSVALYAGLRHLKENVGVASVFD